MTLRHLARAAALRAARALVLPELLATVDSGRRTWPELLEVLGYLNGLEKRHLALGAERDAAVEERDALRLELAEHLAALEEVRARLAAEQRGAATATLIAQREAQQAIAAEALLVAHRMERRAREAEERLRAAQLAAEGGR